MKIDHNKFCGLSKSRLFQQYLKTIAVDQYKILIRQLQSGEGCQSNKKKMLEIYDELKNRNLVNQLHSFLKNKFQNIVIEDNVVDTNSVKPKNNLKIVKSSNELYDKMNFHKVFEIYRPKMLTIPQRFIIVGPSKPYVMNQINRFIRNKLDVDHIILKGSELWHGYIEFFDARFAQYIKELDHYNRPIATYRRKLGIN